MYVCLYECRLGLSDALVDVVDSARMRDEQRAEQPLLLPLELVDLRAPSNHTVMHRTALHC